jgi:cytochrome c oxidase subunit 2
VNPQPLITTTESVDKAFYVIFGISGVALLGITVAMVYFVWRYNRKRQPQPLSQKDHNIWLEITWTVIPSLLVLVMFWYGWEGYLSLRRIPDNAMPVTATARMWSWLFSYENGRTSDKLYVPVGQPVKVKLIAEDVLHSFYVPAFRIKRDTVPGMDNYVWFVAEQPGSYDLFCAEYCGVGHAKMVTTVEAVPPAEFDAWLKIRPMVGEAGKALLQQYGCLGCHSLDGTASVGPSLQGIGGRQVTVSAAGKSRSVTSDRVYLERAIVAPGDEIVEGFPPAMPSFAESIPAAELEQILDYLESLTAERAASSDSAAEERDAKTAPAAEVEQPRERDDESKERNEKAQKQQSVAPTDPVARGRELAGNNACFGCHSSDGSKSVGPSLKGLIGSTRSVVTDGQTRQVIADEAFLERALREPGSDVAEGYPAIMPHFSKLSDEEIDALKAWLESL